MKKLILILALLALPRALSAQAGGCYAVLEGDTLRIGNSLIERSFAWNDGNISTIALADKAAGIVRPVNNSRPDFMLGREKASGGALETEQVAATALHPAYLLARISYSLGTLEVRRE